MYIRETRGMFDPEKRLLENQWKTGIEDTFYPVSALRHHQGLDQNKFLGTRLNYL